MAGAQPSLTAITDDASRGGLFVQSNIANPVSGSDIRGEVVNDTTITLSITINGDTQTQSFTTNQAAISTEAFDFTVAGGTGGDTGGNINGGSFSPQTQTLTLTTVNGGMIPITGFTFEGRSDTDIENIVNTRIGATEIGDLMDVDDTRGTAGQVLSVASDGLSLIYSDPATARVVAGSFSSNDTTVVITQNGTQVDLSAQPEWTGNTNMGDNVGAAGVHAQNIILAADTGLILDNTGGQVTIRLADTAPPPAGTPTATQPPPSSALVPSPVQNILVTPTGGTFMGADPVRPTITPPPGATPVTPTTTVAPGGMTATIMIPGGGTNSPGNYMVMIETDTTGPDGMVVTETISDTIERFVPFFQSRNVITATSLGTESMAAWDGTLTAVPGAGGTLYVAALQSVLPDTTAFADIAGFPVRVSRVGTTPIGVTLADASIANVNVFRLQANPGAAVSNFRSTR